MGIERFRPQDEMADDENYELEDDLDGLESDSDDENDFDSSEEFEDDNESDLDGGFEDEDGESDDEWLDEEK